MSFSYISEVKLCSYMKQYLVLTADQGIVRFAHWQIC